MSLRIPYFRRGAKNTAKEERLSPSERHKKTKKHQTLPEGATLTTQHTSTQLDYSSFYGIGDGTVELYQRLQERDLRTAFYQRRLERPTASIYAVKQQHTKAVEKRSKGGGDAEDRGSK